SITSMAGTNKCLAQSNKSGGRAETTKGCPTERPRHLGFAMKRCAQCHGKLGLGVRFRNVWNGRWWVHVLYCSTHCEALHELERYDARVKRERHAFIPRSGAQN